MQFSELINRKLEKRWGKKSHNQKMKILSEKTGVCLRQIQYMCSGEYSHWKNRSMLGLRIAYVLGISLKELEDIASE